MSVATLKPIFGRKPPSVLIKTGGCWEGTNLPLPTTSPSPSTQGGHRVFAPTSSVVANQLFIAWQSTILHSLLPSGQGILIYIIANYNANNINGNLSISFLCQTFTHCLLITIFLFIV